MACAAACYRGCGLQFYCHLVIVRCVFILSLKNKNHSFFHFVSNIKSFSDLNNSLENLCFATRKKGQFHFDGNIFFLKVQYSTLCTILKFTVIGFHLYVYVLSMEFKSKVRLLPQTAQPIKKNKKKPLRFGFVLFCFVLVAPGSMWDLSSPTADRTRARCSGSAEC